MRLKEAPSFEQKRYVASVCPEYQPEDKIFFEHNLEPDTVTCDGCLHWDDGACDIFDEVLTGIDQT